MNSDSPEERKAFLDDIMLQFQLGNETLGTAIRRLRLEVTGFDQETFAGMCKMSTRALYQIEKDKGNPTLNTIDAILRKFGMRMGLTSAAKDTPSPTLGQAKPASKKNGRGANPRRKHAGQVTGAGKAKLERSDSVSGD
jgi:DNA-binding phage protein